MHDIRLVRDDPAAFDAALARRGAEPVATRLLAFDEERRDALKEAEALQARRNEASKAIGAAKARRDEAEAARLMAEIAGLKERLPALEALATDADAARDRLLLTIPNLPAPDVPEGADENDNQEVKRWGEPRTFAFEAREHPDFAGPLGLDFEGAAAMSGARFVALRGQAARLHRALGQFMLDRQIANGFEEVAPPLLVREAALVGTGQLPKFAEDLFQTQLTFDAKQVKDWIDSSVDEQAQGKFDEAAIERIKTNALSSFEKAFKDNSSNRLWLIPTAEVSLTNLVRERILDEGALPIRLTALTPCFRAEAGAAGRDTRGLIRQHQFDKVEMVAITHPDASDEEQERMTACAEGVLEALGLPYRRVKLCAGDMGFSARRTYDLEVWLPGQKRYREISSVSTCGDFQARRMDARFRAAGAKGTRFVHTLNGSGLAVGRALVAVLETYQEGDGSVTVPDALHPYTGGLTRLVPAGT